jgi:hypothetical protein
VPDACGEDCDGTGIADSCEIAAGLSLDCNANGLPDTCDTTCTVACDLDGDKCLNDVDSNSFDPNVCADSDGDGCDDCSGGSFDPHLDGTDTDADGYCDIGDCAPGDAVVWSEPGSIDTLLASHAFSATSLDWENPGERGSVLLRFDTLRSVMSWDFGGASCLETDETDRSATDSEPVGPGALFFYLIRVENDCAGPGAMGAASNAAPRTGTDCP